MSRKLAIALGILAASALFGLLHFPVVEELRAWTLFACGAGLVFGVLAAWSQSLAAPVLAHVLINWLNLKRLTELQIIAQLDGVASKANWYYCPALFHLMT